MRSHTVALAALLAVMLAVPVLADTGTTTLGAGEQSAVATMSLRAGDRVAYHWSAGLSIEFEITRDGTEVFSTTGPVVSGEYAATADGTYVFSFRNNGGYLSVVAWTLEKHAAPSDLTAPLLIGGVAAAGIVGALAGVALWMRRRPRAPAAPPPPPPP